MFTITNPLFYVEDDILNIILLYGLWPFVWPVEVKKIPNILGLSFKELTGSFSD